MILTEKKPVSKILESLEKDKNIFILACDGCPESAETGGQAGVEELKKELEKAGKTVVSGTIIDFLCNKVLVGIRLMGFKEKLDKADAVLILSCGIGVQAVANMVEKAVIPALDTVSMGGFQGLWPSDERCAQCGDCVLDSTGGVCPITFCSKTLLNGACGGTTKDGKCEIDKEKDCGWHLIYERLKKTGKLEKLKKIHAPRNFKKMEPSSEVRKKVFYNLEN